MIYISGFVSPVPKGNKDKYRTFAADSVSMFKGHGTMRLMEAWEDDVPDGEVTDFRRAVDAKEDEVVVFSWQEFADSAAADAANDKIMNDPAMDDMMGKMPYDGSRMIYGGFDGIYEHGTRGGKPGYVDGSLIPVPTARKDDYRAVLERQAVIFAELGATRFVDAWGVMVPDGKLTDFKKAVQAKPDETVVFSFIEWPDKATRDAAWAKIMEDPRMQEDNAPGDESRRVFGGFVPLVDA